MIVDDDLILTLAKKIDIQNDTPEVVSWLTMASTVIEQRRQNTEIFKKTKFMGTKMTQYERELYKENLRTVREMYDTIVNAILLNKGD